MKHVRMISAAAAAFTLTAIHLTAPAQTPQGSIKEQEARMFSTSAGYERYMGRWSRRLVPVYIEFSGVRNGERVLDVGTGTGAVAAGLINAQPATEVVGIDPSEAFIGYARKDVVSPRARFEIGDAQALAFPDASFDHTTALLVMNFIPDHEKAIREMRRVTRPGGTVSACVWDYASGMEMIRTFWDEVVALVPSLEPKHQRNVKFAREGQLGELWRKAGLTQVQEKPLAIEQKFASFDDYWQPFLGATGAGGALVATLSEDQRRELEARLRARVVGRGDGPFSLSARAWCVRGQAT